MASLVMASLEFNTRYYRPKTIFAVFEFRVTALLLKRLGCLNIMAINCLIN